MSSASEPTVVAHALFGRQIGNWILDHAIGAGGMGDVFLVRHAIIPNVYCALKVLNAESAAREGIRQRFEQEARAAAAAGSHRVVRPIDVGEIDGRPFILMEYVAGESLDKVLKRRGALETIEALKIVWRIADTLAACHEAGVVHRDLKASNVMLERQGPREAVRVLDFGVAHVTGVEKLAVTAEHAIIGTSGYMSPEVALGRGCDTRSDVFALGCLFFELLAGDLPWPRRASHSAWVDEMLHSPPASLAVTRQATAERLGRDLARVPETIVRSIERAIQLRPDQRPTMATYASELGLLVGTLTRLADGKRAALTHASVALESDTNLGLGATLAGHDEGLRLLVDRAQARHSLPPQTPPIALLGPPEVDRVGAVTRATPLPPGLLLPVVPGSHHSASHLTPLPPSLPVPLVTKDELHRAQRPLLWALGAIGVVLLIALLLAAVVLLRAPSAASPAPRLAATEQGDTQDRARPFAEAARPPEALDLGVAPVLVQEPPAPAKPIRRKRAPQEAPAAAGGASRLMGY